VLCLALLVPGYGEKDIIKGIKDGGGGLIRECGKLTMVFLPDTNTDAYLGDLCELRNLDGLDVSGTKITDNGLRLVSQLPGLKELRLSRTKITDKGLRHLESMKGLKELRLFECPDITPEGVARLKKALPGCNFLAHNTVEDLATPLGGNAGNAGNGGF
jgi:hypothetical protein